MIMYILHPLLKNCFILKIVLVLRLCGHLVFVDTDSNPCIESESARYRIQYFIFSIEFYVSNSICNKTYITLLKVDLSSSTQMKLVPSY